MALPIVFSVGIISLILRACLHYFRKEIVLVHAPPSSISIMATAAQLSIKTWNVALTEMNTMNVINLMSTSESRVLPILEEAIYLVNLG